MAHRFPVTTASIVLSATTQWLIGRLRIADERWTIAIRNKRYRDEPTDDKPFTEECHRRYWWADAWRQEFHWLESELFKQRDVRLGLVEGLSLREPLTVYEPV